MTNNSTGTGDYACNFCDWKSTDTSRPLSRGLKVGCPTCGKEARFVGLAQPETQGRIPMPTDEMKERIEEIRQRWASIPPMDAGTSDNGKKCVAYLYEKDFPHKLIATMAELYDMQRLNALVQSKGDVDFLLSELDRLQAENERLVRHIADLNHDLEATIAHCDEFHEQHSY